MVVAGAMAQPWRRRCLVRGKRRGSRGEWERRRGEWSGRGGEGAAGGGLISSLSSWHHGALRRVWRERAGAPPAVGRTGRRETTREGGFGRSVWLGCLGHLGQVAQGAGGLLSLFSFCLAFSFSDFSFMLKSETTREKFGLPKYFEKNVGLGHLNSF